MQQTLYYLLSERLCTLGFYSTFHVFVCMCIYRESMRMYVTHRGTCVYLCIEVHVYMYAHECERLILISQFTFQSPFKSWRQSSQENLELIDMAGLTKQTLLGVHFPWQELQPYT